MSHHRRGFSSPPSVSFSRSVSGSMSSPSLVTPNEEDRRLEFLYRRPSAIQASQYEVTSTVENTSGCFMASGFRSVFRATSFRVPLGWVGYVEFATGAGSCSHGGQVQVRRLPVPAQRPGWRGESCCYYYHYSYCGCVVNCYYHYSFCGCVVNC